MKGRTSIPFEELAQLNSEAKMYLYLLIPVTFILLLVFIWVAVRSIRRIKDFYSLGPDMRGPDTRGNDYKY